MEIVIQPATINMLWTLMTAGALLAAAVLTVLALPWSDREIAQVDQAFRAVGDITLDNIPARTLS